MSVMRTYKIAPIQKVSNSHSTINCLCMSVYRHVGYANLLDFLLNVAKEFFTLIILGNTVLDLYRSSV